jgi:hypothetical protein
LAICKPGIPRTCGSSLQRRDGILQVRHTSGKRFEEFGLALEVSLEASDTRLQRFVARYQVLEAFTQGGKGFAGLIDTAGQPLERLAARFLDGTSAAVLDDHVADSRERQQ